MVESESFLSGVCLHFASLVANICGGQRSFHQRSVRFAGLVSASLVANIHGGK